MENACQKINIRKFMASPIIVTKRYLWDQVKQDGFFEIFNRNQNRVKIIEWKCDVIKITGLVGSL